MEILNIVKQLDATVASFIKRVTGSVSGLGEKVSALEARVAALEAVSHEHGVEEDV